MVSVARRLFPAFMNGCRCIYGSFYKDPKVSRVEQLTELVTAMKISTLKTGVLIQAAIERASPRNGSNRLGGKSEDENTGIIAEALKPINLKISSALCSDISSKILSKVSIIDDPKKTRNQNKDGNDYFEFLRNLGLYLGAFFAFSKFAGSRSAAA